MQFAMFRADWVRYEGQSLAVAETLTAAEPPAVAGAMDAKTRVASVAASGRPRPPGPS